MATIEIKERTLRGQKVFVVDTRGIPNGGRRFFAKKKEAEEHLKNIGVELQSGGILSPEERREYYAAKTILGGSGSLVDAARFFVIHNAKLQPVKIEEAIQQCADFKEVSGKRPRYVSQLRINLRRFAAALPGRITNEIRREEIETFLFKNDWKQSTRRALLIDIKTLFNFAKRRNWVAIHPCAGIERIKVDDRPPAILTPEDAKALLVRCVKIEPSLVPFLAVQLFAGLRPSEARRLSSDDIRGGHIHVSASKSKTRQRRLVPINETLSALLGSNPQLPVKNLERKWRRVRFQFDETGPRKKKVWRPAFRWSPDILRHSFCSYALPIMGAAKVAEFAGHSEAVLFRHYRELVTKEDAERFWQTLP